MVDPKKKGLADIHQGINKFVFVPYRTLATYGSSSPTYYRVADQDTSG